MKTKKDREQRGAGQSQQDLRAKARLAEVLRAVGTGSNMDQWPGNLSRTPSLATE